MFDRARVQAAGAMTVSSRTGGIAVLAVAVVIAVAWSSWSGWADAAPTWLARESPWLARLLDRYQALLGFGLCWAAWREPRSSPALLILCHFYTAITVVELRASLFLGALLALLAAVAAVAMAARLWPSRVILARCMALAAFAIGVDALTG